MNLEHLRYFLVLSKYEHYGRAADVLCISQPGLSHAITALESELGVRLFLKSGRNIKLTQFGEMLKEEGDRIINLADQCENLFFRIQNGGGVLRLAGVINLMGRVIPRLVKDYREVNECPGDFQFYTESTQRIVDGIRDGKYDIGYCSRCNWKNDIEAVPFQRQDMVAVMEPGHPLARRAGISLKETLEYPQITFSDSSALHPVLKEFFTLTGKMPSAAYRAERDEVMAELAACGFGLAVMPRLPSVYRPDLAVVPITSPSWENVFYMIRRKGEDYMPLERNFFQYCRDQAVL